MQRALTTSVSLAAALFAFTAAEAGKVTSHADVKKGFASQ